MLMEFNLFFILFTCQSEISTDSRFLLLSIINLLLLQTFK
jgi:hypothetical protein